MTISLKKAFGAALAALSLTASAAAAPTAIDTEAQLDVMAASGVIQEEINTLYHTWDGILKSGMSKRSHYTFYAAVTDLDHNGRLELLISRHFLNKDPLYYAGDGISEEQKEGKRRTGSTSTTSIRSGCRATRAGRAQRIATASCAMPRSSGQRSTSASERAPIQRGLQASTVIRSSRSTPRCSSFI